MFAMAISWHRSGILTMENLSRLECLPLYRSHGYNPSNVSPGVRKPATPTIRIKKGTCAIPVNRIKLSGKHINTHFL